jgi:hypothetical protein
MIIKLATKADANGNSYQLIFDTEKKTYQDGYYLFLSPNLYTTKKDIKNFIKYELQGYTKKR